MNEGYSSSPHESESEDDHQPKQAYIPIARKIDLVLEAEQSVKKGKKYPKTSSVSRMVLLLVSCEDGKRTLQTPEEDPQQNNQEEDLDGLQSWPSNYSRWVPWFGSTN
ncbi:hypothetical protein ACA910_000600 [Epithemia clementina (nom. ined.)]